MTRFCTRRVNCLLALFVTLVLGLFAGPAAAQEPPEFDVAVIGQVFDFYGSDLNNHGVVVGVSYPRPPNPFCARAVKWSEGVMEVLKIPTERCHSAYAINDAGQIIGAVSSSVDDPYQLFLFNSETDVRFPYLADEFTGDVQPVDINNDGRFSGRHNLLGDSSNYRPFFFDGSSVHYLIPDTTYKAEATSLNNLGQSVGHYDVPTGEYFYSDRYGFLWENGSFTTIGVLGETASPEAVNDNSEVVGSARFLGASDSHAFFLDVEGFHDLGTLGGSSSRALSINNNGWIVGQSHTAPPTAQHAFLVVGGTMHDLNDLVPSGHPWEFVEALKVNDRGQILVMGKGTESVYPYFFLLTPSVVDTVEELIELVEKYNLPRGIENSLVVKLEHALAAIEEGNLDLACNQLGAFANEVSAQSGKKLTEEQAEELLEGADNVRAEIGCQ